MSTFPLCVEMKGSTVFLAGNGKAAADKLKKLLLFEANVSLFTEKGFDGMENPQVTVFRRKLTEDDLLQRPLFVVAAMEEMLENERISRLCQKLHIAVNVVDVPQLCSFNFPALIKRGDVIISIASGGKSPALSAALRQRIEDSLPDDLEAALEKLSQFRQELKEKEDDPEKRKILLKQAAAELLSR